MNIQIDAIRLKVAYDNRKIFFQALKAKKEVSDIINLWNVFSDFPTLDDTKAILNRKEYFILCRFEDYFLENPSEFLFEDNNEEKDDANIVNLD